MDVVKYNNDVLFEIMARVYPADIFNNCMLVCKDWLEVIASQGFRTKYLKRWSNNSKLNQVVGLLINGCMRNVNEFMLPTTSLGQDINVNTFIPTANRIKFFIAKSPNSSHLLFCGKADSANARALHVWTGGPTIGPPLPPPPVNYNWFMGNILSDKDGDGADSYKVILAEVNLAEEKNTLNIQTFCSSTRLWEQSMLTCSRPFHLGCCERVPGCEIRECCMAIKSGIVTEGCGVINWKAETHGLLCLAVWDINVGNIVRLILAPQSPSSVITPFYEGVEIPRQRVQRLQHIYRNNYYGVAPNGSLLSATCTNHQSITNSNTWMIKIYALNEKKKHWNPIYRVSHGSIFSEHSALLSSIFEHEYPDLVFVSFLPGRLDSILVGMSRQLFVYHFETRKLEHLEYLEYVYRSYHSILSCNVPYHPLTLCDLGVWPSSPPLP